jgi:broad specificity phosphatase PhoE
LDDLLAGCDYGTWTGMNIQEVHASDAEGLEAWHADPDSAPHGGERFSDVRVRAAAMLAHARSLGGTTLAFTHGSFVRAALLEVLDLPTQALWLFDVGPGSVTELHPARGSWRLVRLNCTPRSPVPAVIKAADSHGGAVNEAARREAGPPVQASRHSSDPASLAGAYDRGAQAEGSGTAQLAGKKAPAER